MNTCGRCGTPYASGAPSCTMCGAMAATVTSEMYVGAGAGATLNQFGLPVTTPQRPGAAAPQPVRRPPAQSGWSMGKLVGISAGVVVLAVMVGLFMTAAHKDKHNAGTHALAPIASAERVKLQADLRSASIAEQAYQTQNGRYATSTEELTRSGFLASAGDIVRVLGATAADYCLSATGRQGVAPMYYSRAGGMSTTPCSAG